PRRPSFPTRRSSDLQGGAAGQRPFLRAPGGQIVDRFLSQQLAVVNQRTVGEKERVGKDSADGIADPYPAAFAVPEKGLDSGAAEDRKSTRLNYSHVK